MYINTDTMQYPVSERDIRKEFKSSKSFPTPFRPPEPYAQVFTVLEPVVFNPVLQKTLETPPAFINGRWTQDWKVIDIYSDFTDNEGFHSKAEQELAATVSADLKVRDLLVTSVTTAIQAMLENKAIELGYDSVISAVTYADENIIPEFQAEGKAMRKWRSKCWKVAKDLLAANTLMSVEEALAAMPEYDT